MIAIRQVTDTLAVLPFTDDISVLCVIDCDLHTASGWDFLPI